VVDLIANEMKRFNQETSQYLCGIDQETLAAQEWRMNPLSLSKIAQWINCMTT